MRPQEFGPIYGVFHCSGSGSKAKSVNFLRVDATAMYCRITSGPGRLEMEATEYSSQLSESKRAVLDYGEVNFASDKPAAIRFSGGRDGEQISSGFGTL